MEKINTTSELTPGIYSMYKCRLCGKIVVDPNNTYKDSTDWRKNRLPHAVHKCSDGCSENGFADLVGYRVYE
jgi:hypothetical protein